MNIEKTIIGELGNEIRLHREMKNLSQQQLADALSADVNRGTISHLEQASRQLPKKAIVEEICNFLHIPSAKWEKLFEEKFRKRIRFELLLSELVGSPVSGSNLDETSVKVLEDSIDKLIPSTLSVDNSYDALNTVLVYYGIQQLSNAFFEYYLKQSLTEFEQFEVAVENFQKDAIRLFSTFSEAYRRLNSVTRAEFDALLGHLAEKSVDDYSARTYWTKIDKIPNQDLPFLGYIAAAKVRETQKKRRELSDFLRKLAEEKRTRTLNLEAYSTAKKRKMDSFLREFDSKIDHTLSSPLFLANIDAEMLEREAERVSPKDEDVTKIEATQTRAYSNLCNYLAADYLDVYVATSMRSDADFVSVNDFVENLFRDPQINHLKLRYFNPTQSWIADRVAKGLVEALMLKRADICIYMAQKGDTFGKDSEASVTLGQGKAVIVYVPKLFDPINDLDTEVLGRMGRPELLVEIGKLTNEEIDEDEDNEALIGRLLKLKIGECSDADLIRIVKRHWADFDLEGEFVERTKDNPSALSTLRGWLKAVLDINRDYEDDLDEPDAEIPQLSDDLREIVVQSLIGRAIRFEARAEVFREIHPLALQIILSNRVLNGILVTRSPESCAKLIKQLIQNRLETELRNEKENYVLLEKDTQSVIRVISKHQLIANSFQTFYS